MNQPAQPHVVRRHQVVSRLLDLYDRPRYLEIGVGTGATFHRVDAPTKVAVDPKFHFDPDEAEQGVTGVTYHQVTSDEYFGTIVGGDEMFDVIFIDGLHTFEQTLRDLINALEHLQPRGVIVIDDVRPPTYLASLPDREKFVEVRTYLKVDDKRWMGDVYKLVYFIDTFFQQLTYRTIRNNHGQAVVWRERRPSVAERTVGETDALTFQDFAVSQDVLRLTRFSRILDEVREAVTTSS
jgi:hypothetical protein